MMVTNKGLNNLSMSLVACLLILQFLGIFAKCPGNPKGEGSIIFYWKENKEERVSRKRNWGLLEAELEETKYEDLTEFFDPKYVYAYTVNGECCWKLWNETEFKGASSKLSSGFSGIPGYPKFNANSLKKIRCPK